MLFYSLESSDLPSPLGVKAHSTRSVAASKAFLAGVPMQDICNAAGWSTPLTFVRFYDLDLRATPGSSVLLPYLCSSTLGRDLQVWWRGHLVSLAFSTQLEFLKGNVPGYICNHGSPRERDAASQGHTSGIPTRAMLHS